ncbi:tRNA(Ile)-lysidine synthase [Aliiruegeria haliotis]|uniref:tRNA(Ile)-lysidine synthase n=1 Tax=Aliiruegeria haliotis TaxID=1280846 RepID=A0A2T0RND9_9RHOB|nr:tRNA lysidine(34) synthetase TilS [Aliiruegeria haliotis]PRY22661.1 tRNA(Ile)-lysidine synthase [Aliiruegeria haliotis]
MPAEGWLAARFADTLDRLLSTHRPERIGIAVSGGSDSTALLHLTADWAAERGIALRAASVDHGLRPEAAQEIELVRAQARGLGVEHAILRWEGWDGTGNLQDAARRARRRLLWQWARGLDNVLLGHTMDDQAETVLRHLSRGSGVAGLSGIAECSLLPAPPDLQIEVSGLERTGDGRSVLGPNLVRPLLGIRRQTLRDWLTARDIAWSDDPSNEDDRFDRVRVRKALAEGNALGLTVEGLAATATRMRRAREALTRRMVAAASDTLRVEQGDVILRREALLSLEGETLSGLLAGALRWISGAEYRPRASALESAIADLREGRSSTLHGCHLNVGPRDVRLCREWKAVAGLRTPFTGDVRWDGRWRITGPELPAATVQALGDDAKGRDGAPFHSLRARPALYVSGRLVAAPGLDETPYAAEVSPPGGGFLTWLERA